MPTRSHRRVAAASLVAGLVALLAPVAPARAAGAEASISGTDFRIAGTVTNAGSPAEGLLMNSRMVQAVFDDENPSTARNWAYPDTGRWDAERNTTEFVAALPSYAQKGLDAVTIGMQGGLPAGNARTQPWHVSAFAADGSIKPAWKARLDRALRAAANNRMAVILSLFYQAQDQRLANEAAVVRAVDTTVDWLTAAGHTNVVIEVANEVNHGKFDHAILSSARVDELIARIRARSGGRIEASTSFLGGAIPPAEVVAASDFVLLHANTQNASQLQGMVDTVRAMPAYRSSPKPIVFNEDSTKVANLDAAKARGTSWGYYDKGTNDYADGFQSPPVNWRINTSVKQKFFAAVAQVTGGSGASSTAPVDDPAPAPPPTTDTTPDEPAPEEPVTSPAPTATQVSTRSDRTGSRALAGATVEGQVYVFEPASAGVRRVDFHLDDPTRSDAPFDRERDAPYDLMGEGRTGVRALDTAGLTEGSHTVTVAVHLADGTVRTATSSFVVDNR